MAGSVSDSDLSRENADRAVGVRRIGGGTRSTVTKAPRIGEWRGAGRDSRVESHRQRHIACGRRNGGGDSRRGPDDDGQGGRRGLGLVGVGDGQDGRVGARGPIGVTRVLRGRGDAITKSPGVRERAKSAAGGARERDRERRFAAERSR